MHLLLLLAPFIGMLLGVICFAFGYWTAQIHAKAAAGTLGKPKPEPSDPKALARVVRTCSGAPDQWDAWTVGGQYLYLRWRGGRGTVDAYDSPDPDTWDRPPVGRYAHFSDMEEPDPMALEEFLDLAGLRLAPDAVVEGDDEDDDAQVQCWHTEFGTPCDWNICRQPERLARGDYGIDPALARG